MGMGRRVPEGPTVTDWGRVENLLVELGRTAAPMASRPMAERVRMVANEILWIGYDFQGLLDDPNCAGLKVTYRDCMDVWRFVRHAQWAADEWEWQQKPENARALRMLKADEERGQKPGSMVADRLAGRPQRPVDDPRTLPPDCPPFPTRERFVSAHDWVAEFCRARSAAIARGQNR